MSAYEIVPVYYKKRIATFALCDPEDYEGVAEYRWLTARVHQQTEELGYAMTVVDGAPISMHRFVLGLGKGDGGFVHHINRHRRDNRKANLQICASKSEHGRLHRARPYNYRAPYEVAA